MDTKKHLPRVNRNIDHRITTVWGALMAVAEHRPARVYASPACDHDDGGWPPGFSSDAERWLPADEGRICSSSSTTDLGAGRGWLSGSGAPGAITADTGDGVG